MLDVRLAAVSGQLAEQTRVALKCEHARTVRWVEDERDVRGAISELIAAMTCDCRERLARSCDRCSRIMWIDDLVADGPAKVACLDGCRPRSELRFQRPRW